MIKNREHTVRTQQVVKAVKSTIQQNFLRKQNTMYREISRTYICLPQHRKKVAWKHSNVFW